MIKYANLNVYMVNALLQVVVDLGYTPIVQVNAAATKRNMTLPDGILNEHNIVNLNLSGNAIKDFHIEKEKGYISFGATFNGKHQDVCLPGESIIAIFAAENDRVVYVVKNVIVAFMTGAGIIEGVEPEEFVNNIKRHNDRNEQKLEKNDESPAIENDKNNLEIQEQQPSDKVVNLFRKPGNE